MAGDKWSLACSILHLWCAAFLHDVVGGDDLFPWNRFDVVSDILKAFLSGPA